MSGTIPDYVCWSKMGDEGEGWELRSRLRPVDEVLTLVDAGQRGLLEAARSAGGGVEQVNG